MKTFPRIILLSTTLGLGSMTSLALAQPAEPPPPSTTDAAKSPAADHPQKHRIVHRDRLEMLEKKFDLTDEQKAKLKPIYAESRKQLDALHDDKSISPAEKRERMMEVSRATRQQVRAMLTPEQQARFPEKPERPQHGARHEK